MFLTFLSSGCGGDPRVSVLCAPVRSSGPYECLRYPQTYEVKTLWNSSRKLRNHGGFYEEDQLGKLALWGPGEGWQGQPGYLWAAPRPTESWSHRVCLESSPLSLASCLSSFLLFLWCLNHEIASWKYRLFLHLFIMLYVLQGGVSTYPDTPVAVQRITFATWVLRFKLKSSVLVAGACTHWGPSQAPDVIFKWADAWDDFLSQNVWISGNIVTSQHLPDCIYKGWIIWAILSCWLPWGGGDGSKIENGLGNGAVSNVT